MNKFMAVSIALAAACAHAEVKISASRDWTTNLVHNATNALAMSLPKPDYSPSNATLRATIQEVAPAPGEYGVVSNRAMHAVQDNGGKVSGFLDITAQQDPWNTGIRLTPNGFLFLFGGNSGPLMFYGADYIRRGDEEIYWPSGSGTLAFASDIPDVPAWALVQNPPYIVSEVDPSVGITNGTPYVKGVALPSFSTVTGAVQSVVSVTSRYIWDDADEVLYRIDMSSGNTYETPVTNVNALLPENSHILIYLEQHKEEFK